MTLTSDQLDNTYAVAHDTSIRDGGTAEQAHRAGLLAVDARACHDYEATRPAVSDEELAEAFIAAYEQEHRELSLSEQTPQMDDDEWEDACRFAGIRAVRERLDGTT